MKKRVADIAFDILVEEGITNCFSVVGGGAMHLNNAMALNEKIEKYFNHHEQACAMGAEAYARYSGKIAAVCVTSGPGATNAVTGVMGAWEDSLPMIVISGNVRYETSVEKSGLPLRYRGIQEFDIIGSVKNMTKYAMLLKDPLAVRKEVKKAIKIALHGRRGPVWIDIPQDVQNAMVEEEDLYEDDYKILSPEIDEQRIQKAIQQLKNAKRPCILMGTGIVTAHLQEEFEEFAEMVQIPIIGGAWVGDIYYNNHPRFYGLSGNVGPRTGNFIMQNSDLILVLGNSLSYKQTGFDLANFAPKSRIIMVDIDENEYLKMTDKIDLFLHNDLKDFFSFYKKESECITAKEEWIQYCEKLKNKFCPYEGAQDIKQEDRVNKYYFWKEFNKLAPNNAAIALGNSQVALAANQVGKNHKEQRMISNYMCGSMGYDLPAAIGVAIASKGPTICVTGDGSIMMNLQELQTIKEYCLPIKIIIFENQGYGAIKQTCTNFFKGCEIGCSPESGISFPAFSKIAKAFDYEYRCCEKNEDVLKSLQWVFEEDKALILEVKEILEDPVVPKLMSRLDKEGQMSSPKLQDMYPFIPEKDMEWIMDFSSGVSPKKG